MPLGDVFRMSSWTHTQSGLRVTLKPRDRRMVGVFMFLGEEPKDGSAELDLMAAMKRLGWIPAADNDK